MLFSFNFSKFQILSRLEGAARKFYDNEFDFVDRITHISGAIKPIPKGEARKKACLKALTEIQLFSVNYLPSNPESILLEIDYASASPMQRLEHNHKQLLTIECFQRSQGPIPHSVQVALLRGGECGKNCH
jgi:hypothetical protein